MRQTELGSATPKARKRLQRLVALPTLKEHSRRYMRRVLAICEGDITLAAKVLGIGRATLYRLYRDLGIQTKGARVRKVSNERAEMLLREFSTRGPRL